MLFLTPAVGSSVLWPVEEAPGPPAATQSQLWPSEDSWDTCTLHTCDPCADPQEKAGYRNPSQVKGEQVGLFHSLMCGNNIFYYYF